MGAGLEDDAEASVGPLEHARGGWGQMWASLQRWLRLVGVWGLPMRKEKPGVQPERLVKERKRGLGKGVAKVGGRTVDKGVSNSWRIHFSGDRGVRRGPVTFSLQESVGTNQR